METKLQGMKQWKTSHQDS